MNSNRYGMMIGILWNEQARDDMFYCNSKSTFTREYVWPNFVDWDAGRACLKNRTKKHCIFALSAVMISSYKRKPMAGLLHFTCFVLGSGYLSLLHNVLLTWVNFWHNYIKASCVWFHDQTTGQSWVARRFRGDCVVWSKRYSHSTAAGRHS